VWVEAESGCKLAMLRTDRGGEFTSKQFTDYCMAEGVQRQLTAAYSPQQNGVDERRNAMVVRAARSMIKAKGLPGWFWGEAVVTVVYLLNRVSCKANDGKTPFEVWYGKTPAVHHLKTFGCIIYVRNTKAHLKKLDDRGRKMIFIGYERGTKAYRAYDLNTRGVTISRDVIFDEEAQWDWSGGDGGGDRETGDGSDFTVEYWVPDGGAEHHPGHGGAEQPEVEDFPLPEAGDFHQPEAGGSSPPGTSGPSPSGAGDGSPFDGVHHNNPLFDVDEEHLAADYNNKPLRFRTMSDLIGPVVPPGQAPHELSKSDGYRLFTISAEEPATVMEVTREL
jgi:hypothetical protein